MVIVGDGVDLGLPMILREIEPDRSNLSLASGEATLSVNGKELSHAIWRHNRHDRRS